MKRRDLLQGAIAGLATASTFSFASLARAARVPSAKGTLHVIIAADTRGFKEDAKRGIENDVNRVRNFFEENSPANRLGVYVIDTEMLTKEAILDQIHALKCNPEDAVLFYYSGHAANYGDSDPEYKGQFFQLKDKDGNPANENPLTRGDLRYALLNLQCATTVLLTDCCNVRAERPQPERPTAKGIVPKAIPQERTTFSPVLDALFFAPENQGLADLTSSKLGQFSFALKEGSIGTLAWLQVFEDLNGKMLADETFAPTWKIFHSFSVTQMDNLFQKAKEENKEIFEKYDQEYQTAYAYSVPGKPRLGAEVVTPRDGGVRVIRVLPDSPAEQYGLREGDLIVEISWAGDFSGEGLSEEEQKRNERLQELMGKKDLADEQEFSELIDAAPAAPQETYFVVRRREKVDRTTLPKGQKTEEIPSEDLTDEEQKDLIEIVDKNGKGNVTRMVWRVDDLRLSIVLDGEPEGLGSVDIDDPETLEPQDTEPQDTKPQDAKPQDTKPQDTKPQDTKPQDTKPQDTKPQDTKPQTTKPQTTKPQTAKPQKPKNPIFGASVRKPNVVVDVEPNSPAQKAGLKKGDKILTINNKPIKNPGDYDSVVGAFKTDCVVVVERDGAKRTLTVVSPSSVKPVFGASLSGAMIVALKKDGPAAKAGLQVGDVVYLCNGKRIGSAQDLANALRSGGADAIVRIARFGSYQQHEYKVRVRP